MTNEVRYSEPIPCFYYFVSFDGPPKAVRRLDSSNVQPNPWSLGSPSRVLYVGLYVDFWRGGGFQFVAPNCPARAPPRGVRVN